MHNEHVREGSDFIPPHSLPLNDYYIIYEVGMCAVLYLMMYTPSAEMQHSARRCLHLRSITVALSVEQRSLTDA